LAIRMKYEISANKIAPTLSAITLKRSKSISREYAEAQR
jgi:hypothetical protein